MKCFKYNFFLVTILLLGICHPMFATGEHVKALKANPKNKAVLRKQYKSCVKELDAAAKRITSTSAFDTTKSKILGQYDLDVQSLSAPHRWAQQGSPFELGHEKKELPPIPNKASVGKQKKGLVVPEGDAKKLNDLAGQLNSIERSIMEAQIQLDEAKKAFEQAQILNEAKRRNMTILEDRINSLESYMSKVSDDLIQLNSIKRSIEDAKIQLDEAKKAFEQAQILSEARKEKMANLESSIKSLMRDRNGVRADYLPALEKFSTNLEKGEKEVATINESQKQSEIISSKPEAQQVLSLVPEHEVHQSTAESLFGKAENYFNAKDISDGVLRTRAEEKRGKKASMFDDPLDQQNYKLMHPITPEQLITDREAIAKKRKIIGGVVGTIGLGALVTGIGVGIAKAVQGSGEQPASDDGDKSDTSGEPAVKEENGEASGISM